MAYFSNASEADGYREEFCDHCLHDVDKCAVWFAHFEFAYPDCNNNKSILNILIPRASKQGENQECRMFIKKSEAADEQETE